MVAVAQLKDEWELRQLRCKDWTLRGGKQGAPADDSIARSHAVDEGGKPPRPGGIDEVKKLRSYRRPRRRRRLAEPVFLKTRVKKCLVFHDRTADRTAELIAYQVVLQLFAITVNASIGKPVFRGQSLNPVVLEQRTMPFIGPALEHGVGDEPANFAILGAEVVSNDAILFDRIR